MTTTKLYRSKTLLLVVILVAICCIAFSIYGLTLPDLGIGYKVALIAGILVFIYYPCVLLIGINDPVLTLTNISIQVTHQNKDFIYLWRDILTCYVRLEITSTGVGEYLLTIGTKTESKTFNIGGISKTPEELKELINSFRRVT